MAYWRLKKDSQKKNDPYDLTLPVERNKHKVSIGRKLDQMAVDLHDVHGKAPSSAAGRSPAPRNDSTISMVSTSSMPDDTSDNADGAGNLTDMDDGGGLSFQLG